MSLLCLYWFHGISRWNPKPPLSKNIIFVKYVTWTCLGTKNHLNIIILQFFMSKLIWSKIDKNVPKIDDFEYGPWFLKLYSAQNELFWRNTFIYKRSNTSTHLKLMIFEPGKNWSNIFFKNVNVENGGFLYKVELLNENGNFRCYLCLYSQNVQI